MLPVPSGEGYCPLPSFPHPLSGDAVLPVPWELPFPSGELVSSGFPATGPGRRKGMR